LRYDQKRWSWPYFTSPAFLIKLVPIRRDQRVWQIHQWFDLFFSTEFHWIPTTTKVVHNFSSCPPISTLENITWASHGKCKTRFPNYVINRGSQQSDSPSATSAEKSCYENRRKMVQSNVDVQVVTTFSSSDHGSLRDISAFLGMLFWQADFSKLRNKSLVFLLRKRVKQRSITIYSCVLYELRGSSCKSWFVEL